MFEQLESRRLFAAATPAIPGDANFDGKVNVLDFGVIDFNVDKAGPFNGAEHGDFNYDGKINILDYGIIDAAVGATSAVHDLVLINADNNQVIGDLADGTVIDLAATPRVNVRADTVGAQVGSVKFVYDNQDFRTESSAPYAFAGDTGGVFNAWSPTVGQHRITATSFSLAGGSGITGVGLTANFTVINGDGTTPPPTPTAPAAPTSLGATAPSSSRVNLTWTDNAADETGFWIERSIDGVNFTTVQDVGANVKSWSDTALAASTTYYFRVGAFNAAGNSAYSNTATVTTPAVVDNPNPNPGPAGFANESNTGPTNRGILQERGSFTVTQDGAVVENFILKGGTVTIRANNVTLRNFVLENPGTTGAAIKIDGSEFTGTVVEDGEIFGGTATNGVSGSNYTARRLHIHHMQSDAFRVKVNVTIEGCYVHDYGMGPESHGDGVQMYPTDGGNMRIVGNTFDAAGTNSALFQVNGGWHIEGNYFAGGNYTIQCGGEVGNKFINNTFAGSGPRGTSKYGPIRVGSGDENLLTWTGNVWAATGAPVAL